ncbi:MAG: type II toxin-antitoxin system death-on-curing family toxin [Gemmatimonadaceae bacterium]|nr:type II toxin-antitoxin system death-on-curing family toxin [Gemmatimonadaceae bacterium]
MPRWLDRRILDAIQEDQRRQHGGNTGVLSDTLIRSALARPQHLPACTGADAIRCAASLLLGLAKNHGYQDANKRTAYMAALTFLRINAVCIRATPHEIIALMVGVATDAQDEPAIEAWLRAHQVPCA